MFGREKQAERCTDTRERLIALEGKVEKLSNREAARDRELRELVTEWNSVYEKFNTLWARLRKRDALKKAPESPQEQLDIEEPPNPLAVRLMTGGRT